MGTESGRAAPPGVVGWFLETVRVTPGAVGELDPGRRPTRALCATAVHFPQSPLAPRCGQAGTKRNHAPW